MYFEGLANELVLQIFHSCGSVHDVLALAATCHRFHRIFSASQKLPILAGAAEAQYGPIQDAIQVATHNASQAAHLSRRVPMSLALLRQVMAIGAAAQKWSDIYPLKKWKQDYASRRLLTADEAYRARRAVYRLWLYGRAFHNARYTRTTRMLKHRVLERAELLHNWSTAELAEMEDVREIIREVLQSQVCPSNGTMQRKFHKRFPDGGQQPFFDVHLDRPRPPSKFLAGQASAAACTRLATTAWHEAGSEGWGDDIPHYYVVEDMLKLDPGQIMWLRENAPLKGMVEGYVRDLGDWFENNGETFGQTLEWVVEERGEEARSVREEIAAAEAGIVRDRGRRASGGREDGAERRREFWVP